MMLPLDRKSFLSAFVVVLLAGWPLDGAEKKAVAPLRSIAKDSALLRIVVMDPLSIPLACDCVAGYAQRDYDRLGAFLEQHLDRSVEVLYAESLLSPRVRAAGPIHLIIGKLSEIDADARTTKRVVRTLAMLSGKDGQISQTGLFVVRQDDPAQSLADLKSHRLLFGPADAQEKHSAAIASMEAFDLPIPKTPAVAPSCSSAALAVVERDADAAVVSSYAMPLLQGCGTIDKGALRIIAKTDPVPFIAVCATEELDSELELSLVRTLLDIRSHSDLLTVLETRDGFVRLPSIVPRRATAIADWPDWRGTHRDSISSDVPRNLPAEKRLLWSRVLTGPGMSGLAVADGRVLVADKNLDDTQDVFRCLDADTGQQVWQLSYPAKGEMDFTNSPRATPVIRDGLAYLLGAFGQLHCVELATGKVVWKRNLAGDFGSEVPTWGFSSTPLVVDDKLIVNPGAAKASLVALNRRTGDVVWSSPGDPPGYSSFLVTEFSGVRQVIGYDAISLGGWDPNTGQRLWRLVPEIEGDYNVPTPVRAGNKLLVSTENNGTRLYGFDAHGQIRPIPEAVSEDLMPHTSTPVAHDGLVFGSDGRLVCLDLKNNLKTLWSTNDDPFADYCSFIAGNGHILVTAQSGKLSLVSASKPGLNVISSLDLFADVPVTERDIWSHPALVGNRFYVRNLLAVYCFLLD